MKQIIATLPDDVVRNALAVACQLLSDFSRGMPLPSPGSPEVALLSILSCSGVDVVVIDEDEVAQAAADAIAKAKAH